MKQENDPETTKPATRRKVAETGESRDPAGRRVRIKFGINPLSILAIGSLSAISASGMKALPKVIIFLLTAAALQGKQAGRPNILLIMSDDIGMECLATYGGESHKTPHLDALAASGLRFNHAHSQPLCTPSRVQLMTGIHNNRNYLEFGRLDPEATTFANLLRDAGYKTVIGGKWQLKGGYEGPGRFGFDRYCLWQLNRRPSRYPNPGLEIDGKQLDFKDGEFGPDIVTDYLCRFIDENKDGPFLVYYPMMLPHWPFVPTPDHPDYDPEMWRDAVDEPGGFLGPKYWPAMVSHTDRMVGKMVAAIKRNGLRDNTLILWTADNGTFDRLGNRFRGRDYKGGKGSTTDNGTHVGFIASWPGVIKAGQTSDSLVDFTDVLPTLADVTGAGMPDGLDGVSITPVFRGDPRNKDHIYCWYSHDGQRDRASQHVRDATHKLYGNGNFHDVVADPAERVNLAADGIPAALAETHARLKSALDGHMAVTRKADPVLAARRGEFRKNPERAK
jgi:arylsulfatase A